MIDYCNKCIMPSTKPDIYFNENGICSGCISFDERQNINWDLRKKEFEDLINKYKSQSYWDCIIPVSGGKDSTYQVIKALEYDLNPLCVNATTCDFSDLGRKNLDNIKNLGVDVIEFSPNKQIRSKLNKIGLIEVGDITWPEHVGIFTIPVSIAVKFNINLIIWGENSQNEYGAGPLHSSKTYEKNRQWLEEFGGLLGMRVSDIHESFNINKNDILPYIYPDKKILEQNNIFGIFLGYFFPWDGQKNFTIAKNNGFQEFNGELEGSLVNYENLDNFYHGIHDYYKYLKFGFARATDQACLHIRRGLISREEAFEKVKNIEGKFPWSYLDKGLEEILKNIDISVEDFIANCDRFTNKKLFKTDSSGKLKKNNNGDLFKIDNL